jgi:hypothetical protein
VLTVRIIAPILVVALAISYPVLAELSFEVGMRLLGTVKKMSHEILGERLKVSLIETYLFLASLLGRAMREVAGESFLANIASERHPALLGFVNLS